MVTRECILGGRGSVPARKISRALKVVTLRNTVGAELRPALGNSVDQWKSTFVRYISPPPKLF